MEQTQCSETSACKIQTPRNHPKERIQKIKIRRLLYQASTPHHSTAQFLLLITFQDKCTELETYLIINVLCVPKQSDFLFCLLRYHPLNLSLSLSLSLPSPLCIFSLQRVYLPNTVILNGTYTPELRVPNLLVFTNHKALNKNIWHASYSSQYINSLTPEMFCTHYGYFVFYG